MSSCFLCDCSYKFLERDRYTFTAPVYGGQAVPVLKYMKQLPIIVGSSGTELDDQQHVNSKKQNYFPYRVKKIEFRCSRFTEYQTAADYYPERILIFKVPFREPIFDYYFYFLSNFMLYSEPESVLGYKIFPITTPDNRLGHSDNLEIDINKPFIVGPNEYVGVLYMFNLTAVRVEHV